MSEDKHYSIGEVAKMKHVTVKALRHYHETGLLVPSYVNPETGYRYYTLNQLLHLDIIKLCRQSDTSIKELQRLFEKADMKYLRTFFYEKKIEMMREKEKLEKMIRTVEQFSSVLELSEKRRTRTQLKTETFPERYFIYEPVAEGDLNEIEAYEKLDLQVKKLKLQHSFQYGLIYRRTNSTDWKITHVCLLINKKEFEVLNNYDNISTIRAGQYLTISFSKDTEDEVANSLMKYVEKHHVDSTHAFMFYLVTDLFDSSKYYGEFQIGI